MNKRIIIIIVTFNGQKFIKDCLNSIYIQDNKDFGVLVVDNFSTDDTKNIIKNDFPQVKLIEEEKNHGFAIGNNIGIKKAFEMGAEYVVLLNQDTEVAKDFIEKGLKFMDKHTMVGISSSLIFFPQEKKIWFAGTKMYRGKEILKFYKLKLGIHINKKKEYSENDKNNSVDWIPGCAMFIRKEVIDKVGYLDETFFMYGEDVDFSIRVKKAGFLLSYFSNTYIVHKELINIKYKINIYLFKKVFLRTRARFKIINRYYSISEKFYYLLKLICFPFREIIHVIKK